MRMRAQFPTTKGGMQNGKVSRNVYTMHARFCTFGADAHAQSMLISKVSASELSRKFIKSALLVGVAVWVVLLLTQPRTRVASFVPERSSRFSQDEFSSFPFRQKVSPQFLKQREEGGGRRAVSFILLGLLLSPPCVKGATRKFSLEKEERKVGEDAKKTKMSLASVGGSYKTGFIARVGFPSSPSPSPSLLLSFLISAAPSVLTLTA